MVFKIDSNNGNSSDSEYFSWGRDGAPGSGTGDSSYDKLKRPDVTGLCIGTNDPDTKLHAVETQYGLDTVMQITPVEYELISDKDNRVHIGFKAQEIRELIPEAI